MKILWLLIISIMTFNSAAKELVIGVEEIGYAPYYYVENGQYQGFAKEYFETFASQYGHQVRFKPLPIKRLYKSLTAGHIDFKFPDHPLWAKEAKAGVTIAYSSPVVEYIDGLMVSPKKADITLEQIKTIGTVRGFTAWDYLGAIKSGQIKSREVNSLDALMKMSINHRLDGAYFNIAVAKHALQQDLKQTDALIFAKQLPHTTSHYTVSTLKHNDILKEIDQFNQSQQANAIRDKYHLQ
ncbi:MAG: hypothetical protein COB04_11330 [Gammaproteobacteria bacterium]|nr:MAG: hypothetical protein COB04_11330 [Gammaproteobacteria bacterium]